VGDEGSSGAPPAELLGSYTATLTEADLPPNPPPELADGLGDWSLTIAGQGGPDGGPALSLVHSEQGNLESPSLSVDGDRCCYAKRNVQPAGPSSSTTTSTAGI